MNYNGYFLAGMLAWATACQAQTVPTTTTARPTGEFGQTADNLIYSAHTMGQLRHIVDSLNLKHKVCELRRAYRSQRQGQAHYVRLEADDLAAARQALAAGITPEEFKRQFPQADVQRNLLVIRKQENNGRLAKREPSTVYESIPFNNTGEYELRLPGSSPAPGAGRAGWVISSSPKTPYSPAYVEGFYFPAGMRQVPLPARYAALVQYADCLIDTTAQIYLEPAKRTGVRYRTDIPKTEKALLDYAQQQMQQLTMPGKVEQQTYWTSETRQAHRLARMDQVAKQPEFRELLARAVADPATLGATDDEFEEYVARYFSAKKALEYKRNRIVVGGCSMDDSPRVHALGIAKLSAETVNWETFLRAHLDIMNDRFERVSDGSYAQAGRQTYLRELEELDINVPDLMLGISLRIDNASSNHYFGSLHRLGRALAETQQPQALENRLLAIITDPELDDFNRVLAYYLFLNYAQNLADKAAQPQKIAQLNAAVQQLPSYLAAQATVAKPKN
ncbi:MAG TPA: hypothetical protein VFO93_12920 [Hymenobacter sp.]|uniref:hypothetical protein n=1 Tax=Hymenobacter sp. TaxID=1898978 RepID=UPI002D8075F9|nr:hypothetical protein [Hymenobacter sp.]HET9504437.1 hypothetical protein [Hymenobacter sp.]